MHGRQAAEDSAERYLEVLRGELRTLGMASEVVTSGSEPRLRLGSPYIGWDADSCFEGHVLAAHVSDAGWCYWWPWVQVIGPADDPVRRRKPSPTNSASSRLLSRCRMGAMYP